METTTNEPEGTITDVPNEQPQRPNWTAEARFKEACDAADHAHSTDLSHKEAVCEALRRTLCLIEDYRGEHREEIAAYLKGMGVKADKLEGDKDVLAIVQHVFARCPKQQWTWHANALRQAIADKVTSDTLPAYFKTKSPTQAAKEWRKANSRGGGRTPPAPVEVTLTNLKLPAGLDAKKVEKIAEKGLLVTLCKRDGKFALLIP